MKMMDGPLPVRILMSDEVGCAKHDSSLAGLFSLPRITWSKTVDNLVSTSQFANPESWSVSLKYAPICKKNPWLLQANVVAPTMQPSNQLNRLDQIHIQTFSTYTVTTQIWLLSVMQYLTQIQWLSNDAIFDLGHKSMMMSHQQKLFLQQTEQVMNFQVLRRWNMDKTEKPPLREGPNVLLSELQLESVWLGL